jgi:hypothetical protein
LRDSLKDLKLEEARKTIQKIVSGQEDDYLIPERDSHLQFTFHENKENSSNDNTGIHDEIRRIQEKHNQKLKEEEEM